jgi:hypothetical protein
MHDLKENDKAQRVVTYRVFEASFGGWDRVCTEATEFASTIETEDLISISQSKNANRRTVIVWYRAKLS